MSQLATGAGAAGAILLWLILAGPGFLGYGANLLWAGAPKSGIDTPYYDIQVTPGNKLVRRRDDVPIEGRVVASCDTCDTSAVGAQLTLTLPPVFSGGPSLSLSADSTAQATGASFGIPVAPSQYELTITPTDDPDAQPRPAGPPFDLEVARRLLGAPHCGRVRRAAAE